LGGKGESATKNAGKPTRRQKEKREGKPLVKEEKFSDSKKQKEAAKLHFSKKNCFEFVRGKSRRRGGINREESLDPKFGDTLKGEASPAKKGTDRHSKKARGGEH